VPSLALAIQVFLAKHPIPLSCGIVSLHDVVAPRSALFWRTLCAWCTCCSAAGESSRL